MTINEKMVELVGELIAKHGLEHTMSGTSIKRAYDTKYRDGKTGKGSIIPSDYCYNRTNGPFDTVCGRKPTLFEHVTRNRYRLLGENYPYNGDIRHKVAKGREFIIGKRIDGEPKLLPESERIAVDVL
jgi:hypothetical protein